MSTYETLTRPDIFEAITPYGGIADTLEKQGHHVLHEEGALEQPSNLKMTVAIRTLNEARPLAEMLDSVQKQFNSADTEVIVVDNESSDGTPEVARRYGAQVLTIARGDFSYARAMNMAMDAASNELVFNSVGHAIIASKVALEAAKRHFAADTAVAGVYAFPIANYTASKTDKLFDAQKPFVMRGPKEIKKARMGVMGATNAVFVRELWEEYGGFDERAGMGGEDTALARKMLADGFKLIFEPLVTVHHSHGLGPINYIRQLAAWNAMKDGKHAEFDAASIQRRRPDLNFGRTDS